MVRTTSSAKFAIKTATGNPFYSDGNIQLGGRMAADMAHGFEINRPLKTNSFCDPPPCVKCLLDLLGNAPGVGCGVGIYSFGCTLGDLYSSNDDAGSKIFDFGVGAAGTIASCSLA